MYKKLFLILVIPLGCTSVQQNNRQSHKPDSRQYRRQTLEQKKQATIVAKTSDEKIKIMQRQMDERQSDLDQQRILEKKNELTQNSNDSEGPLFGELRDRYESNDHWGFSQKYKIFMAKFPKSAKREEVLYLKGLLEFSEHNYGPALLQFNKILKEYPKGRRAASALLAKGATFRRMNLIDEASSVFKRVSADYAGQVEASRAKLELQFINK